MLKRVLFIALLLFAPRAFAIPTLVQHVSGPGQDGHATTITTYSLRLPNVVGSGNAVIVGVNECIGFSGGCNAAPTPTSVTDDAGNNYGAAQVSIAATNNKLFVYVLCNITNSPRQINVNYAALQIQPFRTVVVSEYYHVATAACVDTTNSNAPGTSTNTLKTGVFTTATSGDLIWTFGGVDDTTHAFQPDTELASWTAQGSYSTLDGNVMQYTTTAAFVAAGTSPCSPTACDVSIYGNCPNVGCSAEPWATATVALKVDNTKGTAPTVGAIHVDRIYHQVVKPQWCTLAPPTCTATQTIPRGTANLLVFIAAGPPGTGQVTAMADGTNTWALITYDASGNVWANMGYTQPTTPDTAVVTWTYSGNTGDSPTWIYVISNAALNAPHDKHVTCTGNDTGGSPTITLTLDITKCSGLLTPAQANELLIGIIATNNNAQGESVISAGPSPNVAVVADSNPEAPTSLIDENDGASAAYLTSTATFTPTWTINNDTTGTGNWTDIHALFEQAPPAVGGRLRTLIGVGR